MSLESRDRIGSDRIASEIRDPRYVIRDRYRCRCQIRSLNQRSDKDRKKIHANCRLGERLLKKCGAHIFGLRWFVLLPVRNTGRVNRRGSFTSLPACSKSKNAIYWLEVWLQKSQSVWVLSTGCPMIMKHYFLFTFLVAKFAIQRLNSFEQELNLSRKITRRRRLFFLHLYSPEVRGPFVSVCVCVCEKETGGSCVKRSLMIGDAVRNVYCKINICYVK